MTATQNIEALQDRIADILAGLEMDDDGRIDHQRLERPVAHVCFAFLWHEIVDVVTNLGRDREDRVYYPHLVGQFARMLGVYGLDRPRFIQRAFAQASGDGA